MKIKNSVKGIRPDASIILICIALLVACPVRIFQMLKKIDSVTGFFDNYSNVTIMILYGVLAVAAILILILTFLSEKIPASITPKGKRIPLAVASALAAAGFFYDAINSYLPNGESSATLIQNAQSVSVFGHLHAIFAFLASCYLIVFAISYFSGRSFHKKLKILSLAPLAWSIVCIFERITVIISIMRVSELFLEICALVFLMIFFMSFARVASDINAQNSMWSVLACGSIAAMFILSYSIPRIMLMLTGNADSLVMGYPINLAHIGCAVFILFFIVTVLRKGYAVEDVKEMYAEIQQAQENAEDTPVIEPMRDADGNVIIYTPEANTTENEE